MSGGTRKNSGLSLYCSFPHSTNEERRKLFQKIWRVAYCNTVRVVGMREFLVHGGVDPWPLLWNLGAVCAI